MLISKIGIQGDFSHLIFITVRRFSIQIENHYPQGQGLHLDRGLISCIAVAIHGPLALLVQSFENFHSAIFFKLSKIPFMGQLEYV